MTYLMDFTLYRNTCWTLLAIALGGCVGAHAAKAHARSMKQSHISPQSYSEPHRAPAAQKDIKPLVGELMA